MRIWLPSVQYREGTCAHIASFFGPLEPLANQLLAISVQSGGVPVRATNLMRTIQEGKALVIGGWCAVECCSSQISLSPIPAVSEGWGYNWPSV